MIRLPFTIIPRRKISFFKVEFKDIFKSLLKNELKQGKYVEQFEKLFASFIRVKYAIAVSSGSQALSLILRALELPPTSEIILPAYTDEGVIESIINSGHRPSFIDINENTFNMNETKIERKINSATKVILATHIFGLPCELQKILEIARKHKLFVVEDCAHAVGAEYNNRKVGSFGECAIFSFAPTKPFNTFGGGMITTNNEALYKSMREKIKAYTFPSTLDIAIDIIFTTFFYILTLPLVFLFTIYPVLYILSFFNKDLINAYNRTVEKIFRRKKKRIHKFTNVQAMIGIRQLSSLDARSQKRITNALSLNRLLKPTVTKPRLSFPSVKHIFYFYIIRCKNKEKLSRCLLRRGIDVGKYPMRNCAKIFNDNCKYPITERINNQSLQIPVDFTLGRKDIEYIARQINKFYK